MTEQERAVLEAALELNDVSKDARAQASWAYRASSNLNDAVAAYRKSLEPKPRYVVLWSGLGELLDHWVVTDCLPLGGVQIAETADKQTAERICRLLNQEAL